MFTLKVRNFSAAALVLAMFAICSPSIADTEADDDASTAQSLQQTSTIAMIVDAKTEKAVAYFVKALPKAVSDGTLAKLTKTVDTTFKAAKAEPENAAKVQAAKDAEKALVDAQDAVRKQIEKDGVLVPEKDLVQSATTEADNEKSSSQFWRARWGYGYGGYGYGIGIGYGRGGFYGGVYAYAGGRYGYGVGYGYGYGGGYGYAGYGYCGYGGGWGYGYGSNAGYCGYGGYGGYGYGGYYGGNYGIGYYGC